MAIVCALLGLIVVSAFFVSRNTSSSSAQFRGTTLEPPISAPLFQLQDQFGRVVSLFDLRGKVVVLAFVYTNCPDVCPIITEKLRQTYDLLGDASKRVAFVAVAVDPERDSVEQVHRYSEERGMLDKWSFLIGSREQLEPLWAAYYVGAERDDATGDGQAEGQTVTHSTPVYLLDRQGRLRVVFTSLTLDASSLAHDIHLLLR